MTFFCLPIQLGPSFFNKMNYQKKAFRPLNKWVTKGRQKCTGTNNGYGHVSGCPNPLQKLNIINHQVVSQYQELQKLNKLINKSNEWTCLHKATNVILLGVYSYDDDIPARQSYYQRYQIVVLENQQKILIVLSWQSSNLLSS